MNKELAETLLARTMGWDDETKARERARLEILAAYKYDQYQQFAPGRRFLESLALWLRQFTSPAERNAAYKFIRQRLVFISDDEMNNLVDLTFPTIVQPMLLADAANDAGITPSYRVKAIVRSTAYRARLRQTLFLGLSDGARTDRFRRVNPSAVSNEQVFHAYDVSEAKAASLSKKLKQDLATILKTTKSADAFRYVVLLDDFTASGTSYIRVDKETGEWDGKIPRIIEQLRDKNRLGQCVADTDVRILVVIYIASSQAIDHIERHLAKLPDLSGSIELRVVLKLSESTRIIASENEEFFKLINDDRYFDPSADDEHGAVGGISMRYGYAGGQLPVILNHNTPNNSIYLLWAEDAHCVSGLFPRVSRHRRLQ